jgi:hypothetical protein
MCRSIKYYLSLMYIRNDTDGMKNTRRSENGMSRHLLLSVPADRVVEVEAALTFLEGKYQQQGSRVGIALIVQTARRSGWKLAPRGLLHSAMMIHLGHVTMLHRAACGAML